MQRNAHTPARLSPYFVQGKKFFKVVMPEQQ